MDRRLLGVIVSGGGVPLDGLGFEGDAALTPFAGQYRFIDFALATLANSGVRVTCVAAAAPTPALRIHLDRMARAYSRPRPTLLLAPSPTSAQANGRGVRLRHALGACGDLADERQAEAVAVLLGDHILQIDLRQMNDVHRALHADVTLATLPVAVGEATGTGVLQVGPDRQVRGLCGQGPGARPGLARAWTGDLMVSPAALPALLAALRCMAEEPADLLTPLLGSLHVVAYDVEENRLPGTPQYTGAYWHDPTTLEAYYDAQMDLCTPRPALNLYNPAWPLPALPGELGPAKVVADQAGRAGQALNTLVSDGALIRGGVAVNAVLGRGVVIESGAEVEDSVLLDGCRVGRGARVRRALVGTGAVIADGEEIGYGRAALPMRMVRSGLTIVPSAAPSAAL
jgi:glucose-1-phosphate adenylyltransferase